MILKGKGGLQYDLSAKPLAAGGEGEIFDIAGQPGLVAKIYKPGKTSLEKEKKLVKMVNEPPDKNVLSQIAWPQDVLYNAGQFVGFVMPKMNIYEDLNVIYEYGSAAKYPQMPWENRLIIAVNLCVVLDCVHAAGHTCGDFNPKNISVDPNTGHVMFLDTDSYHIQDGSDIYRCDVGIPEYLPVEIQMKMRGGNTLVTAKLPTFSQSTDNFALAIHIFQLLMNGDHPFACAIIPSQSSVVAPQPSDNIIKGEFPFVQNLPGIRIPSYAPPIAILPKNLQELFERAFIEGHLNPADRPEPIEWHTALQTLRNQLMICNKVPYHQYFNTLSTCPWCDADNKFSQQFASRSSLSQITIKPLVLPPTPKVVAANVATSSVVLPTVPTTRATRLPSGVLSRVDIGSMLKWSFLLLSILITPYLFSLNIPLGFVVTNMFLLVSLIPLVLLFRNRRIIHIIFCVALSLMWILDSFDTYYRYNMLSIVEPAYRNYNMLSIVEPAWTALYISSWITSIAVPSYTDDDWSPGAIILVLVVGFILFLIVGTFVL